MRNFQGKGAVVTGRWVVRAIRDDQLHIVPHPATRERVELRHAQLMEAYEWAAAVSGEIES